MLPQHLLFGQTEGVPGGALALCASCALGILYRVSPLRTGTVLFILVPSQKVPDNFLWNEQENESMRGTR